MLSVNTHKKSDETYTNIFKDIDYVLVQGDTSSSCAMAILIEAHWRVYCLALRPKLPEYQSRRLDFTQRKGDPPTQ